MLNPSLYPKANSIWTDSAGRDVIVVVCCNLQEQEGSLRVPEVIYTDATGHVLSHPLMDWQRDFRPSVTQEVINTAANAAWALAIRYALTAVETLRKEGVLNQDINKLLVAKLNNLLYQGVAMLRESRITTGKSSHLYELFGNTDAYCLAMIYDSVLRANPTPGFLFASELYASLQRESTQLNEKVYYVELAKKLVELKAALSGEQLIDEASALKEIILWPIMGFPVEA